MNQNYDKTLNLPKTDFPMRANLPINEPKILEFWKNMNIYKTMNSKSKDFFILHDGPPFANGKIHIGHCFNKILKDIILKYNSIIGKSIKYIPGWDCHGLPIEHQVSKKIKDKNISKIEIREKCQDFAMKFVESQKEEFKRLGVFGDWENPYLTMNPVFESNQINVFSDMFFKGYIYRGLKPVNWSPSSRTALAEAELEYPEDHISKSVYVKFEIDLNSLSSIKIDFNNKDIYLLIWTTTPWTLPANKAVSINKDFKYGLYKNDDELLIMESELSEKISLKSEKKFILLSELDSEDMLKIKYFSPLSNEKCPILIADYVTREAGTGLVHTAPGHGTDDYSTGVKNNLDIFSPVNAAGRFTDEVSSDLAGLNVLKEGNLKVIDIVNEKSLLFFQEDYNHKYPYDWRTGKPTIFRSTYQWFASVDKFKEVALKEINEVHWYPPAIVNRITNMVKERSDWCISRQRSWGLPIPVFYDKKTSEVFLNQEVVDNIIDIFQNHGSSSWWRLSISELLPENYKDKADSLVKGEDTLDVWFDSGTSWKSVLENDKIFPADLYLEGNDQHRGWFQSSLLTSVATNGKAPYKAVLTHGFVVDSNGQKMSKSKGNVIEPEKVINQNGADIVRLWVSSEDYSSEIRISENILNTIKDKYKKLRNTLKFLLGNLSDFEADSSISFKEMEEVDKWILVKFSLFKESYLESFRNYSFHQGLSHLLHFCSNELSSIYLDIQKDVLYTYSKKSKERISSQSAILFIFNELAIMLAPIISFTAEEAWIEKHGKNNSIFSHELSQTFFKDSDLLKKWEQLMFTRELVLKEIEKSREEKIVGSSLEANIIIEVDKEDLGFFQINSDLLKKCLIVSQLQINQSSNNEIKVLVSKTKYKKCQRCWMYFSNNEFSAKDSNLCLKCETQLSK